MRLGKSLDARVCKLDITPGLLRYQRLCRINFGATQNDVLIPAIEFFGVLTGLLLATVFDLLQHVAHDQCRVIFSGSGGFTGFLYNLDTHTLIIALKVLS